MAYSATTVFPALVCALTRTDWFRSRASTARAWNGSRTNGYVFAGTLSGFAAAPDPSSTAFGDDRRGFTWSYVYDTGRATSWRHVFRSGRGVSFSSVRVTMDGKGRG